MYVSRLKVTVFAWVHGEKFTTNNNYFIPGRPIFQVEIQGSKSLLHRREIFYLIYDVIR